MIYGTQRKVMLAEMLSENDFLSVIQWHTKAPLVKNSVSLNG